MMIYALADPLRGNTHVRVTMIRDAPDSGIVIHFIPGSLDAEGGFLADRLIGEVRRPVPRPEAVRVRGRAAARGAPVTAGEQEWRKDDLLAHLDEVGWEPR